VDVKALVENFRLSSELEVFETGMQLTPTRQGTSTMIVANGDENQQELVSFSNSIRK
jgi:hypothetical protein